ncbi:MAG: hypothetical protein K2X86_17420 [Cytophagaceae bacterium]|nr:hypothetical protein [Cytophagaceae bacterium]
MPKYRLLTLEELKALEKEFIDYLILNSIAADDWEKLKKEDIDSANHIIDLFSDVVFESIMRKVDYLEYREEKNLKTFQCLPEKIVLVGMMAGPEADVDFTDPVSLLNATLNPPDSLKVYTSEKAYTKQREIELFEMTEAGCSITDGKLFKTLCLSLPK